MTRAIWWGLLFLAGATALAQAQPIQVVTETTPYAYVADGKVGGVATSVVEHTLNRAGLKDYTVRLYPWARAYDMALKEPNVLIFLLARTPERERQFQWAGQIMKIQYYMYRLKIRSFEVTDLESAKAYTIGVQRDDVRQQYLQSKGFEKLVVSGQLVDSFRQLLRGQVDMVPMTEDTARVLCQETQFNCSELVRALTIDDLSVPLYMAYSLQTAPDVVQRTRQAFRQLNAEGKVQRLLNSPEP